MGETELSLIVGKITDYKICESCGSVNWYENELCHNCHNKYFREVTQKWIDDEYAFWCDTEGYSEEESDHVVLTII